MKRNFTHAVCSLFAIACLGLQSCKKLLSNLKYDLSMQSASVNIKILPISDTSATVIMGSETSVYNIDSFIKSKTSNQLGTGNISSAKISSCTITLLNPNVANNFANFQNSFVSFYTNTNTTPYSAATISNNPDVYAATLSVPVDATTDLKSYLNGNQFTYILSGKMRRATTDTLVCKVEITWDLQVHG